MRAFKMFVFALLFAAASLGSAVPALHAQDTWIPLAGSPAGLLEAGAIVDPIGNRMILFGGESNDGVCNRTWVLSLTGTPGWAPLATPGTAPPARWRFSAVYDPVGQRMLIFGGSPQTGGPLNDVWALTLSGTPTWSPLNPVGPGPSGREGAAAIYDTVGQRLILFGGDETPENTATGLKQDVWALNLAGTPTWSEITPAVNGPTARLGASALYDPIGMRMILWGGYSVTPVAWSLSLAGPPSWSALTPGGTPPPAYPRQCAFYDLAGQRMVLVAWDGSGTNSRATVWGLTLGGTPTWSVLLPASLQVPARQSFTAAFDPVGNRVLIHSGFSFFDWYIHDDTWALTLGGSPTWSRLPGDEAAPGPLYVTDAVYDSIQRRMIILDGNHIWCLPSDGPAVWSRQLTYYRPPLSGPTLFDPIANRLIVVPNDDDLLFLDLARPVPEWSENATTGGPGLTGYGHTVIYDPAGPRLILFGGAVSGGVTNSTWSLRLNGGLNWQPLAVIGPLPPPRVGHLAAYDPVTATMYVLGGYGLDEPGTIWALHLGGSPTWEAVHPAGGPGALSDYPSSMNVDPNGRRLLIYHDDGTLTAMNLDGPPEWHRLTPTGVPPIGRRAHVAVFDPVNSRLILQGGECPEGWPYWTWVLDDTWALAVPTTPAAVPEAGPAYNAAALRVTPNPFSTSAVVRFTLARAGRVQLDVFDAAGRRVRRIDDRTRPAGPQEAAWDGQDDAGSAVAGGVYFIRARGAELSLVTRVVRTR